MGILKLIRFSVLTHLTALVLWSAAAVSPLSADPIGSIAKKISSAAKDLKSAKIAVLPFPYYDGRHSLGPTAVSERIAAGVLDRKDVAVVERARTENLIRELTWQSLGAVDQQMVRQVGRVLGVEAVVAGTLIELDAKHVEVVAHLVLAETGEVLMSASCEVKPFWKEAKAMPKSSEPAPQEAPQDAGPDSAAPSGESSQALVSEPSQQTETPAPSAQPEAAAPPPQSEIARIRLQDPIVLDTRGEGGLEHEDYELLNSNWPDEVKQGGDRSQLLEGYRLLKLGDASRAVGIFTLLERRFRKQPASRGVARLGISLCQFQQGRKSAAAGLAGSVAGLTEHPAISAAAHYILGRYAETFGRHRKARGHFLDAIRVSPFQTPLIKAAAARVKRLEAVFAQR